eukprot:COSAG01_NODE_9590_length_2399_cov_7.091304_2_plen_352_part_00
MASAAAHRPISRRAGRRAGSAGALPPPHGHCLAPSGERSLPCWAPRRDLCACTDSAVAIASQVAVLARATVATTAHRERSQVVGGSWGAGRAPTSGEAPRASRAPTAQQHSSTATASRKSIETPADKDAKSQAAVKFDPPLSAEKQDAIRKIGMGTENKVLLRFKLDSEGKVFFAGPLLKSTKYWQVPDERFRFLSLHAMGKPGCLLVHVSPPTCLHDTRGWRQKDRGRGDGGVAPNLWRRSQSPSRNEGDAMARRPLCARCVFVHAGGRHGGGQASPQQGRMGWALTFCWRRLLDRRAPVRAWRLRHGSRSWTACVQKPDSVVCSSLVIHFHTKNTERVATTAVSYLVDS